MSTEVKTFQIRDKGTCIPVMCVRIVPELADREFLRAGFRDVPYVIMTDLQNLSKTSYDPHSWEHRTHSVAHLNIRDNWHELEHGEVIDVEYILGETKQRKEKE